MLVTPYGLGHDTLTIDQERLLLNANWDRHFWCEFDLMCMQAHYYRVRQVEPRHLGTISKRQQRHVGHNNALGLFEHINVCR